MKMEKCDKDDKSEGIASPMRKGGKIAMKGNIRQARMDARAKGKKTS